jgi:2-methylcitrate dehydratase
MTGTDARVDDRFFAGLLRPGAGRTVPGEARIAARLVLLDSVAVGLGTLDHPAVGAARGYVDTYFPREDVAVIWGTDRTSSVEGALIANSVPLRCYDFNDVLHGSTGQAGHPSDFVPGLIAVAEAEGRSGTELVDAVITAYDAAKILFDLVNVTRGGWDYANLTGLAAVTGFATLLRLPDHQTAHALGIFGASHIATNQLESGDLSASGNLTMWKRLNGADAVSAALRACHLAASGIEAPSYSLAGEDGFFGQQAGPLSLSTAELTEIGRLERHGVEVTEFKRWPVGTRAQAAIAAALDCRDRIGSPEQVTGVRVQVEPGVVQHLVRVEAWKPHSRETADHSLPFIVALALLYGDVSIDHFNTDEFFSADAVVAMLGKISIEERPDTGPGQRSSYPTRVIVEAGGEEYVAEAEYAPDTIRAVPFRRELESKFHSLAGRSMPEGLVTELADAIDRVEEMDDVRTLTRLLRAPRGV